MITRRALLALGAVSFTTPLAGCSVDSLDSLRPAAKKPVPDHDAVLVENVRTALEHARAVAVGTPFAALHDAQLAALTTASATPVSTAAATPAPGPTPTPSPDQLRASEAALQHRLLAACQRAESGRLAIVFAAMAAGIAQELA